MAFLDNSGDIILDAVLTDAGRKRLAKGDGSFKIVKFAMGDDEINYGLYYKTNASGSAYYDLTILQTPIEVAHTDATISMKHKLYSMATPSGDPQLLYLPELKLNTNADNMSLVSARSAYVVLSEDDAFNQVTSTNTVKMPAGYIDGRSANDSVVSGRGIRIAQGMSTNAAGGKTDVLQNLLTETQFSIVMDRRYLELVIPGGGTTGGGAGTTATTATGGTVATPTVRSNVFSGANNLRVYTVNMNTNPTLFKERPTTPTFTGPSALNDLVFFVKAAGLLQTNENYYYNNFGTSVASFDTSYGTMSVIDTTVTIIGNTMGASVNIPLEVIAQIS